MELVAYQKDSVESNSGTGLELELDLALPLKLVRQLLLMLALSGSAGSHSCAAAGVDTRANPELEEALDLAVFLEFVPELALPL